jgi:hypothetical protein
LNRSPPWHGLIKTLDWGKSLAWIVPFCRTPRKRRKFDHPIESKEELFALNFSGFGNSAKAGAFWPQLRNNRGATDGFSTISSAG